MQRKALLPSVILLTAVILSACNLPTAGGATPTTGQGAVQTAAALTVIAIETQIAQPATATPPGAATATLAVATTTPTAPVATTPAATPTATGTVIPCNRAGFVDDVTIPDGTQLAPGATFTKTWRLKNTGSCTWTTSYKVVFDSGNAMGGPASLNLPASVIPGQEIDISINLTAPASNGEYKGNWMLQTPSGVKFGLGSDGSKPFWVDIKVGATQPPFAVTSVTISVDNASFTGSCPHTVTFTAKITTSAAGTITYYWQLGTGEKSATQSLTFSKADTLTVTYEWPFSTSADTSISLYNDKPNHQNFGGPNFKVNCQ